MLTRYDVVLYNFLRCSAQFLFCYIRQKNGNTFFCVSFRLNFLRPTTQSKVLILNRNCVRRKFVASKAITLIWIVIDTRFQMVSKWASFISDWSNVTAKLFKFSISNYLYRSYTVPTTRMEKKRHPLPERLASLGIIGEQIKGILSTPKYENPVYIRGVSGGPSTEESNTSVIGVVLFGVLRG